MPGYIHDVQPHFDKARVFVAPLRYGAGMKGKIGQSMQLGLPVVTTSIGAEGMELTHQKNVLVADKAAEYSEQVLRLYNEPETWEALSKASLEAVAKFSPQTVQASLSETFAELLAS